MQCPIVQQKDFYRGNIKMKTINGFKNPYRKEPNLDKIVDQLCTRLQDIKDQDGSSVGMPTCSIEQTEAVRRYYAAFPALKKGQESPLQYYLPPPSWCRKTTTDSKVKMQSELSLSKDWNTKNKKYCLGKERRNSYHGPKKNSRKRHNSYSRSFESKENLPEWMTHEGVWDMETQDPVKEFIRAIALDEGYGTCENTVTDEVKDITRVKFRFDDNMVPDWDDSLDFDAEWVITEDLNPRARSPMEEELYAKFEAKFDRSIEALWSKEQNTPDDEYQDLPIDFQDLLSSPSDQLFADPALEKRSLASLTESIRSGDVEPRVASPPRSPDGLSARLRPLRLHDTRAPPPCPKEIESFALYEGEEFYDALSVVAKTMRSLAAINHSRDGSGFAEVPPRRLAPQPPPPPPATRAPPRREPERDREDPLTSSRTHFRPIRRETEADPPRYADGDTFDIRGDLDTVEFRRSESGGVYLGATLERYLEYRASRGIDYGRLNLTPAQRCPDLDDPGFRLRFPLRQTDAGVQTEIRADAAWECDECGGSVKKMRASTIESIWSEAHACRCGARPSPAAPAAAPPPDELSRDWEELLRDISAAHRLYASEAAGDDDGGGGADRKRRHSAALRGGPGSVGGGPGADGDCGGGGGGPRCSHPHARFLHCCGASPDRPLTR
ncbi:uncharacterized protein LOC116769870 isoform X1 [Danaus plexippus]|uniref:uncharacterized protein LOC116769870 isoform X1 n=2 Tax=Danaus plexippus TaxID=13037 RepID=UPI002AB0AEE8|nr:uncharacterized protein LOC116769870 isoform X1 [Danaus plexippus]